MDDQARVLLTGNRHPLARAEYDAGIAEYFRDNSVQQGYLTTRAKKR